jgi:hypothetical protein
MHDLELVKRGAIWRIGSRSQVKIWRDHWVSRNDSLEVSGKQSGLCHKWVAELINPGDSAWNDELIKYLCHPHDAEAILQIKLPTRAVDDFVAWHFQMPDQFSVRSTYKLGMRQHLLDIGPGQCSRLAEGECLIWNLIWMSPVPQKIRVFGWRLAITEST